jgi:hypothetical protein
MEEVRGAGNKNIPVFLISGKRLRSQQEADQPLDIDCFHEVLASKLMFRR